MPIRTIPTTSVTYALVTFDKNGSERTDDPDGSAGKLSVKILDDITSNGYTDIFLYSHGWKGDVPAAIDQYVRWIKAIEDLDADRARMKMRVPGFKALHVGLHWPSLPFGEEEIGGAGPAFAGAAVAAPDLVGVYAARLEDTPRVRAALQTIVEEARRNAAADTLSPAARDAYVDLNDALDLGEDGVAGDPGSDRMPFDPDRAMEQGNEEGANFAMFDLGGVLGPLRQLSFWMMKKRGRIVGESGMRAFLEDVMRAAPNAKVHLMGHSFGCVVVSSMLAGPKGNTPLVRPVDSCVLVQGAMSLWAYCHDIPAQPGTPGYCHGIIRDRKVRGPIVTTRSRFDRAVGTFYPLAAGAVGHVDFAPGAFPTFGGTGSFGLQGIAAAEDLKMLAQSGEYAFAPGGVYNLEASEFIRQGGGVSGAHSDVAGPEVAHVMWSVAAVR